MSIDNMELSIGKGLHGIADVGNFHGAAVVFVCHVIAMCQYH